MSETVLIPKKTGTPPPIPSYDGSKLAVQFYANNGALRQVEAHTGVSVARLEKWLDSGIIAVSDKQAIDKVVFRHSEKKENK